MDTGIEPLPLQLNPGHPDRPAPGGEGMQQLGLAQFSDKRVTDNYGQYNNLTLYSSR